MQVLACFVVLTGVVAAGDSAPAADPWEKDIRAFEERDRQQPPPQDAVLFLGSSTIRIWDLKKSFPDLVTINRGFGGSQFADSARYAGRIVIPCRPKTIVIYAGDNDIAGGKTPEQVSADFDALIAAIRRSLPDVRIIVLSIKASPARWDKYPKMQQVNVHLKEAATKDPHLAYLDVGTCLFGDDGKPRADLFNKDGLHLNDEGYEAWAKILRPVLAGK